VRSGSIDEVHAGATAGNPKGWDPYAYPYGAVSPHPVMANGVTFDGSAEYVTAPAGTRKRSDGALKNRSDCQLSSRRQLPQKGH
jgi:hypothetical protein